jgi:hypothetical protein
VVHSSPESLALLPEVEARAVLSGRSLSFRLLRPPYAALGVGTLRVLRVVERAGRTEIVAGYDRYERIGLRDGQAHER